MSNIDKILDLELQREIIQLETELLQANVDCLNALDELDEVAEKQINRVHKKIRSRRWQ